MIKGTLVSWTIPDGRVGTGQVVTDEVDGHVFVAIDAEAGYPHPVIYCAVTWLTVRP